VDIQAAKNKKGSGPEEALYTFLFPMRKGLLKEYQKCYKQLTSDIEGKIGVLASKQKNGARKHYDLIKGCVKVQVDEMLNKKDKGSIDDNDVFILTLQDLVWKSIYQHADKGGKDAAGAEKTLELKKLTNIIRTDNMNIISRAFYDLDTALSSMYNVRHYMQPVLFRRFMYVVMILFNALGTLLWIQKERGTFDFDHNKARPEHPEDPDDDPQYWITGNLHMFMLGPPIMTSVLFAFYAISSSYGDIFAHKIMNYKTICECNAVLLEAWKIIEFKMQFLDVQVRLLNNYLERSKNPRVPGIKLEPCTPKTKGSRAVTVSPALAEGITEVPTVLGPNGPRSGFSAASPAGLYDPPLRNIFSRHPHGQTNQKNQ